MNEREAVLAPVSSLKRADSLFALVPYPGLRSTGKYVPKANLPSADWDARRLRPRREIVLIKRSRIILTTLDRRLP